MMKPLLMATSLVASLLLLQSTSASDIVLSEPLMNLVKVSAVLSAAAYDLNTTGTTFQEFQTYTDEPDQALFAKKNLNGYDYCFASFRGTTMTWVDWKQNFDPNTAKVCAKNSTTQCCVTRNGFNEAYYTTYADKLEQRIRECAKTCTNKDECVIFTGHSQGAAVASVAAIILADLNPYVITFGQPTTIDAPCPYTTSERWFRFVNTKSSKKVGITYDPIPFSIGFGADSFGHMIILGDDPSSVAYIGLDVQDTFGPLNAVGVEAHSMIATTEYPGYLDRIKTIMSNASYPISDNGYAAGTLCSENKECQTKNCGSETYFTFKRCIGINCKSNSDCDSQRCDSGLCMPKLGSCAPCDEDNDCQGAKCLFFKCSNSQGLMDNFCTCRGDDDCESGRCDGVSPPTCAAQLGLGGKCNEDSDCKSNHCTWWLVCGEAKVTAAPTKAPVTATPTKAPVTATPTKATAQVRGIEFTEDVPTERGGSGGISILLMLFILLVVVVAGYFCVKMIINWCKGYEEIPSIDV